MAHGGENARAHALMVRPSSPFVTMGSDTSYVGKPKSLLTLFSTLERIGRHSSSGRRRDFPESSSAMNHYSGHHMKRSRSPDDNGSDSCEDDAFSEEMCAVTGSTMTSSSTGKITSVNVQGRSYFQLIN